MAQTIIEKIISQHSDHNVKPGEIVWIEIDVRSARDFGGANVVKNLRDNYEDNFIENINKTCFTFDTNAPANTTGYADNQQICRMFANEQGFPIYDVDSGIGSHILMERGIAVPGKIAVGTDSHMNILGAIGAFGQGMGDQDIAFTFKTGHTWFEVPETMKVKLTGTFNYPTTAKDLTLAIIKIFGTKGAFGQVVEFYSSAIDALSFSGRITLASMATEMGAVAAFIVPNEDISDYCRKRSEEDFQIITADSDAEYIDELEIDITNLKPQIAKPNSPANVVDVQDVAGGRVHSGFIGSCTNGRYEDFFVAASILKGKRISNGFILKIVPTTAEVYDRMLDEGLIKIFRQAGALVSNPGCGGCASGQIGIIGAGEVQVSTANRNFRGKQGKGDTYLASPATVAATALFGKITCPTTIAHKLLDFIPDEKFTSTVRKKGASQAKSEDIGHWTSDTPKNLEPRTSNFHQLQKPEIIRGKAYKITDSAGHLIDDIDTDMIFHNRYLHIKDTKEMGQYAFDNLQGHEDFGKKVETGNILIVGKNFGSGSSRQQAVDCFHSLGIPLIISESTGAIYKRNAINSSLGLMECDHLEKADINHGDELQINLRSGEIKNISQGKTIQVTPFSQVQWDIYMAGNLFNYGKQIKFVTVQAPSTGLHL